MTDTNALDGYLRSITENETQPTGSDVLAAVAVADGLVALDDLRSTYSDADILALLHADAEDKRRKPRLRAAHIGGAWFVWITSSGWSAAGQPNRREAPPTPSTIRHRYAGRNLRSWVEQTFRSEAERRGVLTDVIDGNSLRQMVEGWKSLAWGQVRLGGAQADQAGMLLGGVYPDSLIVETWRSDMLSQMHTLYPHTAATHNSADDLEVRVAVEVELSAKTSGATGWKVAQHDRAMDAGWWHAALWVVEDSRVAQRFDRHLASRNGRHYYADPGDVGLGAGRRVVATTWPWALLLAGTNR